MTTEEEKKEIEIVNHHDSKEFMASEVILKGN